MTDPVRIYSVWDSMDGTEHTEGSHAYFRDLEAATRFAQGLADYYSRPIAVEEQLVRSDLPPAHLYELLLFGAGWQEDLVAVGVVVQPRTVALRRPARQLKGDEVEIVYLSRPEMDNI